MTNDKPFPAIPKHPYPLVFATISGAHLYGFPSPDSDCDIRGVHILPLPEVVGLNPLRETVEISAMSPDRWQVDLVTHDLKKFALMLLKKNGYVLEQLYSPLVIHTSPAHSELKEIAKTCITRHHCYHYLGFAQTQWQLFAKETPHRVKPLLYIFRVLMTGIYLMRTGQIEADALKLNQEFNLPYLPDLIDRKKAGNEEIVIIGENHLSFYEAEWQRLYHELKAASASSQLPDSPTGQDALHDLLVRVRMGNK